MENQMVVVTGASSGIGRATAIEFAKQGYALVLVGRNEDRLQETAKLCQGSGHRLLSLDMSEPSQLAKLSSTILQELQSVHCLVNNAGIFQMHDADVTDTGLWSKMFQVNLFAAVELTNFLLPKMRKGSSIINVASTLGVRPIAGAAAYNASKAAMINWTQTLALHLAPRGIRVNVVSPGIVDTPIHSFHASPDREQILPQVQSRSPLGRIGAAHEIAQNICFLAGSASAWTTGANLVVDGGINL
jgi:NAD(P)-dependent dehydrogenase (short-subunit alcohol dehydrogenase family)